MSDRDDPDRYGTYRKPEPVCLDCRSTGWFGSCPHTEEEPSDPVWRGEDLRALKDVAWNALPPKQPPDWLLLLNRLDSVGQMPSGRYVTESELRELLAYVYGEDAPPVGQHRNAEAE